MKKIISNFSFDFKDLNEVYFKLLKEEDFDFKTKDIQINVEYDNTQINVELLCSNVLELKIATTALIKSLEIIEKTLNI